jgi:hypothetical protein
MFSCCGRVVLVTAGLLDEHQAEQGGGGEPSVVTTMKPDLKHACLLC